MSKIDINLYSIHKSMKKYIGILIVSITFLSCNINSKSKEKRDESWAKKITNTQLHNLYKLNDSMYRCEQPTKNEFEHLTTLGIKSVLNLRATHSDTSLIKNLALKDYSVKITTARFSDTEIIDALKIIKQAPKPLLVHCKHGSDRTGVVIAMYRIIFEGWTKEKALDELLNGAYGFHEQYDNIPRYIKNANIDSIKSIL